MSMQALQSALFPPPPAIDRTSLHAVSIPAKTFTGDFWFTHRAGDRLWFALGDIGGKGLPAALVMAMVQEELEHRIASCARNGCDPSTTMHRLDAFLRPLFPGNRFATAVIGWLRDDGKLRLVNAGHCPPLIVRADGRIEHLGSTGPVVGLLPNGRWQSTTTQLAPGESLILYSDGVVEAASPDGVEFGMEGIEHAVAGAEDCPHAISDAIVEAVNRHANGARADDLTVLVITA